MSSTIVLATQPVDDYCREVLGRFAPIRIATDMKEPTLRDEIRDAIALVVRGQAPVTSAVIDAAPALRVIGRTGVGYDTIDIAAATARGIPVVYTPGVGARAVAEATLAFMLALCKSIQFWDSELRAGNWNSRYQFQGRDLDGRTLGIIGLGRIGKLVAVMAKPFRMRIVAHDPYIDPSIGEVLGVFNDEPPDPAHPIFRNPNCLVSPHSMATTLGAMTRIFQSMSDDVAAILEGRAPRNVVNPEALRG
jgi:phosphoglycerate dehydrogenase-like enzyme